MKPEFLDENFLDFEWINVPEVKFIDTQITEKTKALIIIKDSDLTSNAKILLSKILQSIGIDLANEAALVLLGADDRLQTSQFTHKKESLLCLVMGVDKSQMSMQIEYKINQAFTLSKIKYLFTYDLKSLENSVEYKKELWAALKAL